jgi:hypothetical protein
LKRAASILLLGVLLFNWGGYRLFTSYLEYEADVRLTADLDQDNYDEADLISIKVANNLPYYTANSATYERVDGEITIKGVPHKYVKRRMYNDSLELLCIPNIEKTGLQNAKDKFFLLANDLASDNHSSKKEGQSFLAKFSVQDFTEDHGFVWQYNATGLPVSWNTEVFAEIRSAFLDRLDKPPQA